MLCEMEFCVSMPTSMSACSASERAILERRPAAANKTRSITSKMPAATSPSSTKTASISSCAHQKHHPTTGPSPTKTPTKTSSDRCDTSGLSNSTSIASSINTTQKKIRYNLPNAEFHSFQFRCFFRFLRLFSFSIFLLFPNRFFVSFVGAPYRLCRYGRFFLLALPIGFADTVAFCASIAGWQYAARRPIAQAQYGLLGALCWRIRAPQCGSPCGYRTATTTFRDLSPCLRFPSSPIRHAADMAH